MMELEIGRIVCSKAGRDQGRFLVVVGYEGEYFLLADGKERPVERPKRKRKIHLGVTNTVLGETSLRSNRELRRALQQL